MVALQLQQRPLVLKGCDHASSQRVVGRSPLPYRAHVDAIVTQGQFWPRGALDGPFQDWQEEGPGLLESVRRYRWLVAAVVLAGALAAYAWSSTQPVLYEGTVRVFLEISGDQTDEAASS